MSTVNPTNYCFSALAGADDPQRFPSLCYLIGLTDSPNHKISEILSSKRILPWLYDCEEQFLNAEHLRARQQKYFGRFFSGEYLPQTPCMVVNLWSPIAAMLERGFQPEILQRDSRPVMAIATGIWKPQPVSSAATIESAQTVEDLFWAIMVEVTRKALARKMWINIVAQPGWDYKAAVNSLQKWSKDEVEKADRVLWRRTPEG